MCILRVGEFILALMGPEQVSKDVKRVTVANQLSDLQLVAGIKKTQATRSVPDFLRFLGLFQIRYQVFLPTFLPASP